jgi:hypothetical protein
MLPKLGVSITPAGWAWRERKFGFGSGHVCETIAITVFRKGRKNGLFLKLRIRDGIVKKQEMVSLKL